MNSIIVKAEWDPEVSVWVATTNDIKGMVAEATTLELLRVKVLDMIADLIELNKVEINLKEIPIHILAHSLDRMAIPVAA
jgi:Domain of unknown function (DUF1902)